MVDARRIVRRHFGRDHHPLYRALAQVLATIAWPPAVLVHLWQIRRFDGPEAVPIKRVPGALWAALRHNILPGEYYAYALWQPDRRANIDHYLYSNEAPRLFKVLNRPSQPDPIGDKLAFHEMCKAHALPTPAVLAAFAPTGKLIEFESGRPPERDLFVKPRSASPVRVPSVFVGTKLPLRATVVRRMTTPGSGWLPRNSRTEREANPARPTSSLKSPQPPRRDECGLGHGKVGHRPVS